MMTLFAKGQAMQLGNGPVIATDYVNTIYTKIAFDSAWDEMTNRVLQFTQGDETFNLVVGKSGVVQVPNELETGCVDISAFGYNEDGRRLTTTPLHVIIRKSGFKPDGETPIPPTPDLYAQLLEQIASGGAGFETDETLTLANGVLSVNTADVVEQDNTLPVTSAAVHVTVGNIDALLNTI